LARQNVDPKDFAGAFEFRLLAAGTFALVALFVFTSPWTIAGRPVSRLSAILAAAFFCLALGMLLSRWRAEAGRLLQSEIRISGVALLAGACAAAVLCGTALYSRYAALELSAWDTTIFFDRPIAATLSDGVLPVAATGRSYLGVHASYVLLAFVPFYAIARSPLWLLAAHALAIAAGAAMGYRLFRRILGDDGTAALLGAAFVLNSFTARAVGYGFHPEVFYPLALFGVGYGLIARRGSLLAASAILAISVKEDSMLLLGGVGLAVAIFTKSRRDGLVLAASAFAIFLVSTRIVMPAASGSPADRPWYSFYWNSWGATLPAAAAGMARHPVRLAQRLAHSGIPSLLECAAFVPLAGPEALVASLPALVPCAAADFGPLRRFGIYYSLPVLPFVFAAAAFGIARLFSDRRRRRLLALLVFVVASLDGASYTFRRASPARKDLDAVLASLGDRPAAIQGTLYPHAGYSAARRPLERGPLRRREAVVLAPATDSYPLTKGELASLVARLAADPQYRRTESPNGIVMFLPSAP
jgi:uncharacterized membrane protein